MDIILADIGHCVVKLTKSPNIIGMDRLVIISPSCVAERTYEPSESVEIWQATNIMKLRDFLNEHFPKDAQ